MSRLIDADALEKDGWMMHRTVQVDKDTMSYQTKKPTDFPPIEPEPKWIPCIERLPEAKEKYYWVCTDTGYQCQCRWTNINHFWTDLTTEWHWHIMDTPQYSKVTAWMPLPDPFREEGDA